MYYGASDKEVIEALSLVSLTAGFTTFIDGIEALGDKLTVDK
jgi:alkylhydroperoxidase/carboxymuconolactone decarboxylase family protein YurZ